MSDFDRLSQFEQRLTALEARCDAQKKQLELLNARAEIWDCILRFCRGLDRLDRALMMSAFHNEAVVDYGEMFRGSAEEFVDLALKLQQPGIPVQHTIGNVQVACLEDISARVESYELSHHPASGAPDADMILASRLVDRFALRGGQWRIVHRTKIADWARLLPGTDDLYDRIKLPKGLRSAADLSYRLLDLERERPGQAEEAGGRSEMK